MERLGPNTGTVGESRDRSSTFPVLSFSVVPFTGAEIAAVMEFDDVGEFGVGHRGD